MWRFQFMLGATSCHHRHGPALGHRLVIDEAEQPNNPELLLRLMSFLLGACAALQRQPSCYEPAPGNGLGRTLR